MMLRVLATLDGSTFSEAILPALERLCGELSAEILLITVVEEPPLQSKDAPGADFRSSTDLGLAQGVSQSLSPGSLDPNLVETTGQAISGVIDANLNMLEEAAAPLRRHGSTVKTHVIVSDDPVTAIVQAAGEHNADLIAMATHGRTGLRSVLQGSVASRVLASGVAPVLSVRPTQ